MGRSILYLKAKKLVLKRCVYHLVYNDLSVEIPPIQSVSVSVVKEFPEVLPDDRPEVSPKREIELGIHII